MSFFGEAILSAELTVKGVAYMDQNPARFFAASGTRIIFAGKKKDEVMEQATEYSFYKNKRSDTIWWADTPEEKGLWLFSFDRNVVFNMFRDYPYKLTKEQKAVFDKENPYWAKFFKERG